MRQLHRMVSRGVTIVMVTAFVGCDSPAPVPPTTSPPRVQAVDLSPAIFTLTPGQSRTLIATITAEAGVTDRSLRWNSSNTNVATVDGTGLVRAVNPGTAVISATPTINPSIVGAATVTVVVNIP